MLRATAAPATVVPVTATVCSPALITPSVAMVSMVTDALTCEVRVDTMAVRLVLSLPPTALAAVRAPTMTVSSVAVLRVPVPPVPPVSPPAAPPSVRPATISLMVAWVSPPLARSAPDRAASTAPYFSPLERPSAALKLPLLVATTVVPVRSARPNAAATAALALVTDVALAMLPLPSAARPAFCAAMAVSGLMLTAMVPPGTTAVAIRLALRSLVRPVASSR